MEIYFCSLDSEIQWARARLKLPISVTGPNVCCLFSVCFKAELNNHFVFHATKIANLKNVMNMTGRFNSTITSDLKWRTQVCM